MIVHHKSLLLFICFYNNVALDAHCFYGMNFCHSISFYYLYLSLSQALGTHIRPRNFNVFLACQLIICTIYDRPSWRYIYHFRPHGVLFLIINQNDEAAVFIVNGIYHKKSTRFLSYRHRMPFISTNLLS